VICALAYRLFENSTTILINSLTAVSSVHTWYHRQSVMCREGIIDCRRNPTVVVVRTMGSPDGIAKELTFVAR